MLDDAIALAEHGWRIFPLAPGSKKPAITRGAGGHGCHDATTDLEQVRAWWTAFPQANIGLATGYGFVVVDLDVKATNGIQTWEALCADLGIEPWNTLEVSTPSGGRHLYYAASTRLSNSAGKLGEGIDTRGIGGYVVAPPSVTSEGAYVWKNLVTIQPLPLTIRARLVSRPAPVVNGPTPAIRYPSHYIQTVVEAELARVRNARANRNDALNRSAFALGTLIGAGWTQLSRSEVETALYAAAVEAGLAQDRNCGPRGIENTIRSGLDAGERRPRPEPQQRH